jgi:hypothetical protein
MKQLKIAFLQLEAMLDMLHKDATRKRTLNFEVISQAELLKAIYGKAI